MRRLLTAKACAMACAIGALTGAVSGCAQNTSGSPNGAPPAEFRPACGQPGARVQVRSVPVTIEHRACDLTGVEVRYGLAAVAVPASGRAERQVQTFAPTTSPTHILVIVDQRTHDVTITG
jgi:hypothetical protein